MKKLISMALALVLASSCFALTACGGGDGTMQTAAPTQTSAPSSVAIDFNWDDIPVYPGASDAEEFSGSIPGAQTGEYEKIEWRYYTTRDSVDDAISFYADNMPDNGWEDPVTMNIGGVSWSYWGKDDGDTGAYIEVVNDDGETNIMMWKGMGSK